MSAASSPPAAPCESSNLQRLQQGLARVQGEQDALYEESSKRLSASMCLQLVRDKITQHTRSDADRLRKIFNLFNDGRDDGGEAAESGIDRDEFQKGLQLHFNLVLSPEQTAALFAQLDEDGSGTIGHSELASKLFPPPPSEQWYDRAEQRAQQKVTATYRELREPASACAAPQPSRGAKQIMTLIQDKITQHTRSDADRVRKIFNLFNDGRDSTDVQESGIDAAEFAKGMMQFGIALTEQQAATVFGQLDADSSGTITPRELADGLFPARSNSITF